MKLSLNTDFTQLPRAEKFLRAAEISANLPVPYDLVVLDHGERHLRRRVLTLAHGDKILVDFVEPTVLESRDVLVLADGRLAEIIAAEEEVYDVRARDAAHLAELAWHIGNRHLTAAIEPDRILILRDHVIKAMLEGLGATVTEMVRPFQPVRGAYSGHAAGSDRHHHDHDLHGHGRGEPDAFGRLPGDPHYGHNHA